MNNHNFDTPDNAEKKRRKKRRRGALGLTIYVCIFTLLIIIAAVSYYLVKMNSLTGHWSHEVDITDDVLSSASLWLSDVEGADISSLIPDDSTERLTITVNLEMSASGLGKGEYRMTIDQESYDICKNKTYDVLSSCLEEIIASRLEMVEYDESISAETAHKIAEDVLGQSLNSYLEDKGVSVMPKLDRLASIYEDEGNYSFDLHTITWKSSSANTSDDNDTTDITNNSLDMTEKYMTDSDLFVLPDREITYRKQVAHE